MFQNFQLLQTNVITDHFSFFSAMKIRNNMKTSE